jgi:peroxiredoxin
LRKDERLVTRKSWTVLRARTPFTALLLTASLALSATACNSEAGSANYPSHESPLVGEEAPSFHLPAQFGADTVSPSLAAGKVLIVDFWATWCAPCKDSFPAYQKLLGEFGDKLMVIGVSVDDDPSGIRRFAKETSVSFPLAWDQHQVVAGRYKPTTMPTSFIIDQNGIVRYVHAGFHAGDEKVLERQVRSLL